MVEASIPTLIGIVGLTIFVGYLASIFFERTKIPDVLFLILLGIILGPVSGFVRGDELVGMAPLIGSIALIVIVFDGGTKLNFFDVMDELPESMWFTWFVCILTAIMVMLVFVFGMEWNWIESLLAGVIVAGTSYEIIVPLVGKLSINDKVKTLLNLESAFNDIITIIGMVIVTKFLTLQEVAFLDPLQIFIGTFSTAIFLGAVGGIFWLKVLQNYKGKQFEYLLTLGFVFFLYSLTENLDANGITSIIIFGLILGNSDALARMLRSKEDFGLDPAIRNFNSEVSFFVRTMFFVYIGIILNLGKLLSPQIILVGFFIFLAALFARFVAVEMLVNSNPSLRESKLIILAMLPRGLATAVLAALPLALGLKVQYMGDIVEIVLMLMLFTNIFATLATYYFETRVAGKAPQPQIALKK